MCIVGEREGGEDWFINIIFPPLILHVGIEVSSDFGVVAGSPVYCQPNSCTTDHDCF